MAQDARGQGRRRVAACRHRVRVHTLPISTVGSNTRDVEVRLHPDEIAALSPLLSLPEGQRLVPDLSLSRGDLRVHAEAVRIDGTLDARLRAVLGTVMRRAGAHQ